MSVMTKDKLLIFVDTFIESPMHKKCRPLLKVIRSRVELLE